MSDLEAELAAALKAKSASVTPDPNAWEKHRAAALSQPVSISPWAGHRRVLPLIIAAAVVLVAAVGTSIVVANNSSGPASPPPAATRTATIPSTATAAVVAPTAAAVHTVPTISAGTVTGTEPPPTCTGPLVGSAQLHPAGLTGFTVWLQLRRGPGGDLLCAGIIGAAGGSVQTSTGGTATGAGPLALSGSSTWDQGSPVFLWGAVDDRVAGLHINGVRGQAVQVQFATLPGGHRAFLAVLPPNTKTVTAIATDAAGRTLITRHYATTFGTPDPLITPSTARTETSAPTPSAGATSPPTTAPRRATTPPTTIPTASTTSGTRPPPAPAAGCDGPGIGTGIADLGVGSGMVSFNYTGKILCFSNGGPLKAAHRLPGVMPYAALTTLVSGQGVWGAVTRRVSTVIITDDNSPKGRPAQLLPLGDDLKIFVEETAGPVRLQAFSSTGTLLNTQALN